MALQLSVVVCMVSGLAFLHLRHTLREEAERQISTYSEQRIARERVTFEIAAQNGERFRKELVRRLSQPVPADLDARFERIATSRGDGTYRNRKDGFDPDTMVGVFIGPQQKIDASFRWTALVAHDLLDMAGSGETALFPDLYVTMPNNVMLIYWPGVPWTNDMASDFDMRGEPYFTVSTKKANPSRKQAWTPVFYDAVSKVWMMSFATPIDIGGEHVATVMQDLLLEDFLKRTASQSMQGAHNVIFRAEDEALIFAPGYEKALLDAQGKLKVGDTRDPKLAVMLDRARAASGRAAVVDGGDALLGIGFIPGPDWTFVTVYPKSLIDSRALAGARGIFGLGVLSLFCELTVLFFVLKRSVAAPLAGLTRVTDSFAHGDLSVRSRLDRQDEVGVLGKAFDEMAATIEARNAELAKHAAELEDKVASRTAELAARTEEMKLVLDTVDQGFMTIGLDGKMSAARSRVIESWLGPAGEATTLPGYIAATDPSTGEWLELGLQSLAEGLLPYELSIDQLPKRMSAASSVLELAYTPILTDGEPTSLLVVITDVTATVERDRLEEEQREVMVVFQHITQDSASFTDFVDETSRLVDGLRHPDTDPVFAKRIIHTIKGNTAVMGVNRVATVCHEVEDAIEAEGGTVDSEHVDRVASAWATFQARVRTLLPAQQNRIEISEPEYVALRERLAAAAPTSGILEMLDAWKLEPVERRFRALGERAASTARRLEKGEIEIDIRSHGMRMDIAPLAGLWSALTHLVRNAIDHGLESPEERSASGKSPVGRLVFESLSEGETIVLAVGDDGRGIDWPRVAEKAKERGLPYATRRDLEKALFSDGLSTRSEVTDVSGRGVGMSAVLAEVERLGGSIRIHSTPRRGTRFECVVPAPKKGTGPRVFGGKKAA